MFEVAGLRSNRGVLVRLLTVASAVASGAVRPAGGQITEEALAALRQRGVEEGWTFTVGMTPAGQRPLEQLCGLEVPEDWWVGARFAGEAARLGLPPAFDWRDQGGCPPVRDQGSCGSCWAFATVGPLECNILIRDGELVDLSEQWLVSCNLEGYGCSGGWWAHEYHEWKTDSCGGAGAVLEADFPYAALDVACGCPYAHVYTIDGWAYVGSSASVPSTGALKQAIVDYGPISAAVYVDAAFASYTGGVFNACGSGVVNHGVLLVGWDDNQGSSGVWIVRNSWGPEWGEGGYMLIEYGCSSIGYAASFVEYAGLNGPRITVTPDTIGFGDVAVGASVTQPLTVENVGEMALSGTAGGLDGAFSVVGAADYNLEPGESQDITVQFAPGLQGTFSDELICTGGGGATAVVSGNGLGNGPSDACADAPEVGDGTFTGSNETAGTDQTAGCGDGGTADVWWRYVAPRSGVVVIDTCGSDFDTVLSVYDTCDGGELACNDDYGGCGSNARVTLDVVAGQSRCVRVAGRAAQTGSIVLNIETSVPPRTISGRVTTADAVGVAGVTLTGLPGEPATDEDGYYTAIVDYGFSGAATPRKTAYTFVPGSRSYSNVTTDRDGEDYNAILPTFTVAGHVTDTEGGPISGVSMSGLPGTPVTTLSGAYEATVTLGFSGTVTPVKALCTFDPAQRMYENVTSDLPAEDYTGTLQTGSLRAILKPAAARTAGARWQVDGGEWHESSAVVEKLPVGRHTVGYATMPGWIAPPGDSVSIQHEQTTQLERTYTQMTRTLTIVVAPDGSGEVTCSPSAGDGGQYVPGTVVTLLATPQPGFRVANWIGADEVPAAGRETNTVTMTTHRSVVVNFEVEPFVVYQLAAVVAGGEGQLEPRRGAYRSGEVVALTAAPAAGFQIKAWTGTDDDGSVAATNTVTMTGHKSVSVEFEPWRDCNGDGVSDRANIVGGHSLDCNANGVPDECEPDTDADGVIDDCDEDEPSPEELSEPEDPGPAGPSAGGGFCGVGVAQAVLLALVGLALLRRAKGAHLE